MAFTTASGYGNLPNGNFSPVIYSKKVQLAFRKATVCGDSTNSDYFGEIAAQGPVLERAKLAQQRNLIVHHGVALQLAVVRQAELQALPQEVVERA